MHHPIQPSRKLGGISAERRDSRKDESNPWKGTPYCPSHCRYPKQFKYYPFADSNKAGLFQKCFGELSREFRFFDSFGDLCCKLIEHSAIQGSTRAVHVEHYVAPGSTRAAPAENSAVSGQAPKRGEMYGFVSGIIHV